MKGVKKVISILVRIISITRMKLLMLLKAKKPDHFACKMGLQKFCSILQMWRIKRNSLKKVSKVIKLFSSWSFCLQNGYHSVSGVSLGVMGITRCLVCLRGNRGPPMWWVHSWVGCENCRWEEKSLRVSVSLSVIMGIAQCNGYPLGCVRVRPSVQYPIG
jgi:hypothetical protein